MNQIIEEKSCSSPCGGPPLGWKERPFAGKVHSRASSTPMSDSVSLPDARQQLHEAVVHTRIPVARARARGNGHRFSTASASTRAPMSAASWSRETGSRATNRPRSTARTLAPLGAARASLSRRVSYLSSGMLRQHLNRLSYEGIGCRSFCSFRFVGEIEARRILICLLKMKNFARVRVRR